MTYFNPKIYCKQNLKEKDLKEMEYWKEEFEIALDMAYDKYNEVHCTADSMILDEIKIQLVDSFIEIVKECLGNRLQNALVSCIEGYEEDVEEVEFPETFDNVEEEPEEIPFVDPEDDEEDE